MKKMIGYMLVLVMLLNLTACQPSTGSDSGDTATTTVPTTTTPPVTYPLTEWAHELPKMDGSTSTIPLEAGIRAALFGISLQEAETAVTHNSTYGSYNNLVNGDCDLIFTVQMSQEQISEAAAKGVELEQVPIAAEGFVFVVNAKNPVDTLTQEQLRGIYSGEITNWKEVGGNDAPIEAYQRNETSGSQNYIKIFMGDTPLMEPITEFIPASMGSLMDAVAYYDNAENAIGYSVYAYAADMYGNGNEIKFIHVDGVEPTKETMADGTYPLLSYNYIVFNKAQPADSVVRKLAEWVLTDDGQRAVKAAGYVPLRPVGEVEEHTVALYNAVGTGPEKPTDFVPDTVSYSVDYSVYSHFYNYGEINVLKNTQLQDEINAFIAEHRVENVQSEISIRNGFLSIREGNETAFYDLYAAKEISFTDLYFKGTELASALRYSVQKAIQEAMVLEEEAYGTSELDPQAFMGLKKDHTLFSLGQIYLLDETYHIGRNIQAEISGLSGESVLSIARDMQDLFTEDVVKRNLNFSAARTENVPLENTPDVLQLLDATYYSNCPIDKINDAILTACETYINEAAMVKWNERLKGKKEELRYILGYGYTGCGEIADRYFRFSVTRHMGSMGGVDYGFFKYFDRATGEEVPYDHFFKEGWFEAATWYSAQSEMGWLFSEYEKERMLSAAPDIRNAVPMSFTSSDEGYLLNLGLADGDVPLVLAVIPFEYVDWSR